MELVKLVNSVWVKNFDIWFDELRLFVNPRAYSEFEKMKELDDLRKEINEDNFEDEWSKLMQTVPQAYVLEEPRPNYAQLFEKADAETQRVVAGWVPYQPRKEGD